MGYPPQVHRANVSLELITDPDMYLFIEKGFRMGISVVSHRHARGNNQYMQNYDPEQPASFLMYLDANNLYGWAMSQPMPIGGFQWVDYTDQIVETPAAASSGYILEVDLEYPSELHTAHNDYPLAPEKLKVKAEWMSPYQTDLIRQLNSSGFEAEKLVPNLRPKARYVLQ